jgi:hypothetical protein
MKSKEKINISVIALLSTNLFLNILVWFLRTNDHYYDNLGLFIPLICLIFVGTGIILTILYEIKRNKVIAVIGFSLMLLAQVVTSVYTLISLNRLDLGWSILETNVESIANFLLFAVTLLFLVLSTYFDKRKLAAITVILTSASLGLMGFESIASICFISSLFSPHPSLVLIAGLMDDISSICFYAALFLFSLFRYRQICKANLPSRTPS